MSENLNKQDKPVIIFDGCCNFCIASINYIILKDTNQIFHFTSSQSEYCRTHPGKRMIEKNAESSVILIIGNEIFIRSRAVLKIFELLKIYPLLASLLKILPAAFTDLLYKLVSNSRYGLFGRREDCMIPDGKIKSRFL